MKKCDTEWKMYRNYGEIDSMLCSTCSSSFLEYMRVINFILIVFSYFKSVLSSICLDISLRIFGEVWSVFVIAPFGSFLCCIVLYMLMKSDLWYQLVSFSFLFVCLIALCDIQTSFHKKKKKKRNRTINYINNYLFIWHWCDANCLRKLTLYVISLSIHWHFNVVFYRAFPFKKRCLVTVRLWVDLLCFALTLHTC